MTALHRVKAYFGMVPADELDAYDGYDHRDDGRYDSRHDGRYDGRYGIRYDDEYDDRHAADPRDAARYRDRYDLRDLRDSEERAARRRAEVAADDRGDRDDDRPESHHEYGGEGPRPRTPRPRDPEHTESRREEPDAVDATSRTPRGRSWAHNTGPNHTSVRPGTAAGTARSGPSLSSVPSAPSGASGRGGPVAVDASRSRTDPSADTTEVAAPSEITSLQPTSYNEARIIGERYRDGIPVIMNLSDMDDVAAKRLVDFAAGLAFALRGSIEKVTNRVFLLSPPNVEVSASDRRKLAERGYSATS